MTYFSGGFAKVSRCGGGMGVTSRSKPSATSSMQKDSLTIACTTCFAVEGAKCRSKFGEALINVHQARARELTKQKGTAQIRRKLKEERMLSPVEGI